MKDDWEKKLTPEQYRVMHDKGTEVSFSGAYVDEKRVGIYACVACGNPLFSSTTKFDSGTGWPSFDEALPGAVRYESDKAHGLERTEVLCAKCGGHLGHIFNDPPMVGQVARRQDGKIVTKRYCLNSVCLKLEPAKK